MKRKDWHYLKVILVLAAVSTFLPAAGLLAQDGIVSLNKASVEDLVAVEDLELDEDLAKAIVAYRQKNGPFKKPKDLLKVPGMTEDWYEEINPVMHDGDVVYDPDATGEASMKAY